MRSEVLRETLHFPILVAHRLEAAAALTLLVGAQGGGAGVDLGPALCGLLERAPRLGRERFAGGRARGRSILIGIGHGKPSGIALCKDAAEQPTCKPEVANETAPFKSAMDAWMTEGSNSQHGAEAAGVAPRRLAFDCIAEVLRSRTALADVFEARCATAGLSGRDEALARAIATVAFRHFGTIRHALATRLDKGLPSDERLSVLLIVGAAQILFLDVPHHAGVDTTVRLAGGDKRLRGMAGVVNAVMRRLARERDAILAETDALTINTPEWLAARWSRRYGEATARAIAEAHARGAALDITVKDDPEGWAARLGGVALPTGSVRLLARTAVPELPGYDEGAWWVQDAAAALPARVLRVRPGERIADLCAAPGGKTAQLAQAGGRVLAVDRSAKRLRRVGENMARLGLTVETLAADAATLEAEPFEAILLDAPCSATGTLRRHPDVAWSKRETDLEGLTRLQARLLDRAATLLSPGGRLVYCTCSLEPEEGEDRIAAFLAANPDFARDAIVPAEVGLPDAIDVNGDLRTLPSMRLGVEPEREGLDGFYAARLVRR
jgi:16S rRNA (cytosine967-C5)-methyltransferase